MLEIRTGSYDPPFGFGLLIRMAVHPIPQVRFGGGSGNFMERDILKSMQSQKQVRCFVEYIRNMVARIVVAYRPSAKQEGLELRDVLRRTFPRDEVSLLEIAEFQSDPPSLPVTPCP